MSNNKGMTLVELMVAMVVASIALAIVFYMWNTINKHVAVSRYKTQLETETNRLGLLIVNQIRRSPSIIQWNSNRIKMVHHNGSDTLDYYFNESGLLLNGNKVNLLVPYASVSGFEFRDSNEIAGILDGALFLVFTLSLVGRERDTATVHHAIHIAQSLTKNDGSDFTGF
jgi:prepilin-type N-terminal cleavage/methylation domain-containing protein